MFKKNLVSDQNFIHLKAFIKLINSNLVDVLADSPSIRIGYDNSKIMIDSSNFSKEFCKRFLINVFEHFPDSRMFLDRRTSAA